MFTNDMPVVLQKIGRLGALFSASLGALSDEIYGAFG